MAAISKLWQAIAAGVFCTVGLDHAVRAADPPKDVKINWLEQAPAEPTGVSWGVPWPRGTVQKVDGFALKSADGKAMPLQSWPLAYWPDGSIKWTGLATTAGAAVAGPFDLTVQPQAGPAAASLAQESATAITINAGRLTASLPKSGENLIDSLSIDGKVVARNGHLTCILQEGPDNDLASSPARTRFTSNVTKVTLEQNGPVRAVVKIEGMHKAAAAAGAAARSWLPFIVRLYFYQGETSIHMVHTIIFDGDQNKDFVRGLGVTFSVPFREEIQNRHVRFGNSNGGLWAEPIQPLIGRQYTWPGVNGGNAYPDQVEGLRVPNRNQGNVRGDGGAPLLDLLAVWDSFKLVQPNADGFAITKQTNPQSAWLKTNEGARANGLVFVGDVSGGLAVTLRNFWQSYPASLEVRNASKAAADLNVWMWSPDGPAMDMRHYDTKAHGLNATYEDVQEGFSTATGIGRTSELTIVATPNVPTKADTAKYAEQGNKPALLVATPDYLHSTGVFGVWSLKDTSTPYKKSIEDELDQALAFYEKTVEQSKWYGFWYYGNVMHSYDPVRHNWRYDVGGTAWDNSELGTDMWLWYSFLRSGRADIFRMAEAMTRNTGEVATYHAGRFMGLGTRHGVIPWGDGAKEARIGQAAYRRFYYYLSTDERTGDIMRESLQADFSTVGVDPMREALPVTAADKQFPTRVRAGPDWLAFCGNWMTEWERTGETKYRDKIITGAKCLAAMPYGFRSGEQLVFGYDPKTGQLFQRSNAIGSYNLTTIMGGAEVGIELDGLLDDPSWRKVWRQLCRLQSAPANVVAQDMQTGNEGADGQYETGRYTDARLAAYAAKFTGNWNFAKNALTDIGGIPNYTTQPVTGPNILNPIDEARGDTNSTAQNSLMTIELLEFMKDKLPTDAPAAGAGRGRGGARGGG